MEWVLLLLKGMSVREPLKKRNPAQDFIGPQSRQTSRTGKAIRSNHSLGAKVRGR